MEPYRPDVIWYASDSRARSCFKLLVRDDRGALRLRGATLEFVGRRFRIYADSVLALDLVTQRGNWPLHILGITLLLAALTLRGFFPAVSATVVIAVFLVALAVGRATKWVRVKYAAPHGSEFAWFCDGSMFGWSGIFGGTARLYETLFAKTLGREDDEASAGEDGQLMVLGPPLRGEARPIDEECPWCEARIIADADRCPSCGRPIG
jgi:hypothetical protein